MLFTSLCVENGITNTVTITSREPHTFQKHDTKDQYEGHKLENIFRKEKLRNVIIVHPSCDRITASCSHMRLHNFIIRHGINTETL